MASGRRHPHNCKVCGRNELEVGRISARGKCADCGTAALAENIAAMRARTGPNWYRWRRSMAACVGGSLLDETSAAE